ncbi:MAG TPA: mucoidy inhibitor MuiA family protein [Kofleriaceae bacterium]|nr:mucoidy inhibitor MuiA family protein [Kofleriaceae bacterium]
MSLASAAAIEAPIVSVTVLEDRASVTRHGRVQVAAGQHQVVIERVSPVLVDKTLIAQATGARVLDVRCERYLAPWRDPAAGTTEPAAALRVERVRLDTERFAAIARRDAAASEATALADLATAALRDLALAASRGTTAPAAGEALAALDRDGAAARERRVIGELAVEELAAALNRLDPRIAQAEAEAGEQAARLVIDLVAEAPAGGPVDVELAIGYVVPGAAWRPYHRAVLIPGADAAAPATIDWQTTACVWQATAEDWTDAQLVFSLERPSLGVAPPALADDELTARRRPDTVAVEARDQELQTTGLGGEAPAGEIQVPGIDDRGLGVTLTAARATVVADGAPHRVPVGGFTSAARIDRVAIPLRSPWVHIRARLVNTGAAPLLAGPVDLVRSSGYVGRAEIGFIAPNEKLHLGFGPEADVRVHRTETSDRDDAGLLGGWNVQTVRIAVRLSNLGSAPRAIVVTERIPISEVEQVEVKASPPDAYLLDGDGEQVTQVTARAIDDRGLVTWSVELPPLGRRAVTLEYRIRSQRGVAGV